MPNKKKNTQKKRKSKIVRPVVLANNVSPRPIKARSSKSKARKMGGVKQAHVARVCSVTDPFCPAAKNVKWPDGTSGNTLTMQFRKIFPVITDANGVAVSCYAPAAPYCAIGSTVTAGVATFASAYVILQASSLMEAYGDTYRIVSYGAIIRCIASATTAAGYVTVGTATAAVPTTTLTMGQELYQEVFIKAIQPGMEISWISQPVGTGARDFIAQSTSTTGYSSDWSALYLEVTGAAASATPLAVEIFMNVEFRVAPLARNLTTIARPNPPKSTVAESAVSSAHSSLGSFIEGGVKSVEDSVTKHVKSALDNFLSDPLESIAGLFV